MSEVRSIKSRNKVVLRQLLVKITAYYAILFGLVYLLVMVFPSSNEMPPIGGVGELSGNSTLNINQIEEALLSGDFDGEEFTTVADQSIGSLFLFSDAR